MTSSSKQVLQKIMVKDKKKLKKKKKKKKKKEENEAEKEEEVVSNKLTMKDKKKLKKRKKEENEAEKEEEVLSNKSTMKDKKKLKKRKKEENEAEKEEEVLSNKLTMKDKKKLKKRKKEENEAEKEEEVLSNKSTMKDKKKLKKRKKEENEAEKEEEVLSNKSTMKDKKKLKRKKEENKAEKEEKVVSNESTMKDKKKLKKKKKEENEAEKEEEVLSNKSTMKDKKKKEENEAEKEEKVLSNESILHRVLSMNLPLPSLCRITVNIKNPKKVASLIEAIITRSDTMAKLDNELLYEERILAKLIYKFKNSMHPFLHWRYVCRMAQCSKKRSNLKLLRLTNKLNLSLESFNSFERQTYMPSRKLVEYFLIRLMGAVALNVKTYELCAKCYIKLKQYLRIGHNIHKILTLIALSSRLWILYRTLASELMDLYTDVRRLFKAISPNWKHFPAKLTKWLENNLGLDCSDLKDATPLMELNISSLHIGIYSQQKNEEDIGEPV